jgi:hypothetical protein
MATETTSDRTLELRLEDLEREKWRRLGGGDTPQELFADDFVSISYRDAGTARERKPELMLPDAAASRVNADAFRVMLLTSSSDDRTADAAVVTYRITEPRRLYATSVWVHRDGRWQTVLYQTTPIGGADLSEA